MKSIPNLYLENNLYRFYEDFIGFEDFTIKKSEQFDYIASRKYQWPGYVYNLEANHENCDQLINELGKKILTKEIPPFLIVDPTRVPDDFENKMNRIGVRKIDFWPIIFMDFKKSNLQLKNYPDFTIYEVHDEKQLITWYKIVMSVLFPSKSVSFEFFHKRLNDERYIFQLGYYDSIPATSCMVFMDMENKIAGTYMGATVNEFRKRGLGAEFHTRALLDAEKAGCLFATGQSSRMGFSLWQQIGFTNPNTLDIYWMIGEKY
jgi:hypothetical protein